MYICVYTIIIYCVCVCVYMYIYIIIIFFFYFTLLYFDLGLMYDLNIFDRLHKIHSGTQ